jgi:hypothetical protein
MAEFWRRLEFAPSQTKQRSKRTRDKRTQISRRRFRWPSARSEQVRFFLRNEPTEPFGEMQVKEPQGVCNAEKKGETKPISTSLGAFDGRR